MTAHRPIRKELIESLPPGSMAWDSEVRGFGVRRQRRDAFYLVKYRDKDGRQRVVTIGRHGPGEWMPDRARKEAIRIKGLVRDGRDPAIARDEAKTAPTLASFAERYIREYATPHKKATTRIEDERRLKLYILPPLGSIKLRDIGRADVARLHASLSAKPVTANRAVDLLSAILGWAERVGDRLEHSNPCRHINRYPEKARERLLTAPELARLGDALDRAAEGWTADSKAEWRDECLRQAEAADESENRSMALAAERMPSRDTAEDWRAVAGIRLLILTGSRVSEILTLHWAWIDPTHGLARLPDSKTGAKNIYLPPGALAVLDALPRMASNPHVLPGDRPGAAFVGIQKPWQRIRRLAGLPDLRLHDLRHAYASVAVAAGDSLFIVGKILGHRQSSTTERYSHLSPDPALAVATRTAERLAYMMGANKEKRPTNINAHPASRGK
jgi:integrase